MKFEEYLDIVIKEGASDLYITANAPATLRVNGVLTPINDQRLSSSEVKALANSAMNEKQRNTFEEKHEMNLAFITEIARFRVNIFMQRGELGMVVRSIRFDIPDMESLSLPVKILQEIVMYKRGLILFVGATSSGKSTSLASMIHHRNLNSAGHIITVEDPLEFIHQHQKSIVNQREVGFDTHSYQDALENTLRQAPDVILIGEIRSRETMEHAVTFAETGHLCLSTLHANNANQAFARILSFFPPDRHARVMLELSLNVRAIVSQRLIPCIQGGRVPAVEILLDSPLVKDLIKRGEFRDIKDVMKKSELTGMQTFDQALFKLYKAGKITYENALANADSQNDLRLAIQLDSDLAEAEAEPVPVPETITASDDISNGGSDDDSGTEQAASPANTDGANKTMNPEDKQSLVLNKLRERTAGLSLEKSKEDIDAEKAKSGLIRRN
jgi:twitching motility protein PilU